MSDAEKDTLMEMCHQQVFSISKMTDGGHDFIFGDGCDKNDDDGVDYEKCGLGM